MIKKTKKWIIWIIIVAAIIGGIAWYIKSKKPITTYTTAEAVRGNLAQTVSVTGDLVAADEITLNFELGGRVGKVFVRPSDKVAAGDKIATLVDSTLQKQVEQAKYGLDQAIAQAGTNNDELREAKVLKDNNDNVLSQTKDLNDQNIAAAKNAVSNAQKTLDDTKDYYNSEPDKFKKISLTNAENALEAAKKALEITEQQADLSKINAENAVDISNSRIKTVQSAFARDVRSAQIAQAQAANDLAILNLNKATLSSPVNGIITEVNNKSGEILGTGVIKEAFSRVMSLDMIIESKVPESDIVKIKLGQHAKITFDALTAEDIFDGEIIEIDPASTDVQGVVYYQIKLKLNTVNQFVKPGMSLNVDISTAQKDDVISVPSRAIKTEDNKKKYVDVLQADNTTKKVSVETGLEGDEGMVEIKKGLNGGERVITFQSVK